MSDVVARPARPPVNLMAVLSLVFGVFAALGVAITALPLLSSGCAFLAVVFASLSFFGAGGRRLALAGLFSGGALLSFAYFANPAASNYLF